MGHIKILVCGIVLFLAAFGAWAETVDINTATAEQIAHVLKGIGKAKAEAIVQEREKNGKFKSADDLARVKGIKGALIAKNRDKISVGGASQGAATPPAAPVASPSPAKPAVSLPARK